MSTGNAKDQRPLHFLLLQKLKYFPKGKICLYRKQKQAPVIPLVYHSASNARSLQAAS